MIKCNSKLFLLESKIKSRLRLQVEVRCIIFSCSVHKVSNWQQLHFKLLIILAKKSGSISELYGNL